MSVWHACTHNNIYIYIYIFFWVLLYNHNNGCVLCSVFCVCGLCVVCLCVISVFVFGGSVGVFVCWVGLVGGCVCVLCVHILPKIQFWKFQFWNWNLEKNNLKKFWKSYNINNISFFFVFFLKDFIIQLLLINIILVAVH